ncbi:MAG: Beta-lactamase domain protein [Candidatus Woesebacteria bacterium GW2011_GWB1_43_14]|uniref:Beta-lactamase domain protein n=1 Tax=Candidatus Woesebacteria bacterium GW2011_GWB1_43_14 TaxID=1618578 RepID=A0A0G1FPR1_9BACT|nr:MAG: Beta-lactamase domain protein [Candidatus Woesebacteria bacterium GW2011_GWB1_43_14]
MAKVIVHGAGGMVTGSSYEIVSNKGTHLLIDFGMFQGPEEISELNFENLKFDPKKLEGVFLTHAHLDHCGRLPLLVKNGYNKNIYMTRATADLVDIALHDTANINEHDDRPDLFDTADVNRTLSLFKPIEYHVPLAISDFVLSYYDAGHILGSASIEVKVDGEIIAFSGDLGNSPEDLIKPTEKINEANYVFLESTYGGRIHPDESSEEILRKEINTIEITGGALLIPAFSIERTQILLHLIDHFKKDGKIKPETKVFLDSPMASKVTKIFKKYPDLYNRKLLEHASKDDPFSFPGLATTDSVLESKNIIKSRGAKVIIAGSGMMTGGRILHHAIHFLPQDTTRLLIVGFQAKGTMGRRINEGERDIKIYGKRVKIRAQITEISGLSAHADQPQLLDWLRAMKKIKQIILIHGEDEERMVLAEKIKTDLGYQNILLPKLFEEINLS